MIALADLSLCPCLLVGVKYSETLKSVRNFLDRMVNLLVKLGSQFPYFRPKLCNDAVKGFYLRRSHGFHFFKR